MKIEVRCNTKHSLPMEDLTDFQGNLKYRTNMDVARLVASIKEFGFSFPFFVWLDPDGRNYIVDGHGRIEALTYLKEVGYEIPELPVVYINADSPDKAKELLLTVNSQYGDIDRHELYLLIDEIGADIEQLSFDFDNPYTSGSDDFYNPALDPVIDTSGVSDNDVARAGNGLFDMSKEEDFVEFTCTHCDAEIYVKRSVIARYLRGEFV